MCLHLPRWASWSGHEHVGDWPVSLTLYADPFRVCDGTIHSSPLRDSLIVAAICSPLCSLPSMAKLLLSSSQSAKMTAGVRTLPLAQARGYASLIVSATSGANYVEGRTRVARASQTLRT